MKKILKTIGFGIALGAAIFFVPFIFKFILIAMVIGMVFRMFAHHKRRRFAYHFSQYESMHSPIVPIDNRWYKSNIHGNGQVHHININY